MTRPITLNNSTLWWRQSYSSSVQVKQVKCKSHTRLLDLYIWHQQFLFYCQAINCKKILIQSTRAPLWVPPSSIYPAFKTNWDWHYNLTNRSDLSISKFVERCLKGPGTPNLTAWDLANRNRRLLIKKEVCLLLSPLHHPFQTIKFANLGTLQFFDLHYTQNPQPSWGWI